MGKPSPFLSFASKNSIELINELQINFFSHLAVVKPICRIFEKIRQYFGAQSESIPMSFVLGFYVTLIVKRWWDQYKLLPWPDTLALFISAAIPGNVSFIMKCE